MQNIVKPSRKAQLPWKDASKALLEAWKVLRKRWAWMLTVCVSAVALAAFYTAGQTRIYRATCIIQIDPKPPRPLGQEVQAVVDVGTGSYWTNAEYNKTQFQIIQSRTVAEETVRRLGLHRDETFLKQLSAEDKASASPSADTSVEMASNKVRANLVVDPVKDSRLVSVSYRDPSPERARQILSTLVSVYVDRNIDVALDSTNAAADWLQGQVDNLKKELENSELALHEYKKGNRILSVSIDDQSNMLRQEMQQLSAALTAVRVRRTQVAAQVEEITKLQPSGSSDAPVLSTSDWMRDPALQQLRTTAAATVAERDALLGSGKGESHPLVVSATARVRAADEALRTEVRNLKESAQRDLAMANHEVDSLSKLFNEAQERALELGRLEIDYRRLDRGKVNTEKLYSMVLERSKESDLTRMMRFNNIQVIDAPLVPLLPVSPRVPLNMAIGLLGGVALGLMAAFGRELFDQSVKSGSDIEDMGLTTIGILPRLDRAPPPSYAGPRTRAARRRSAEGTHSELLVHEDPTNSVAEAARALRTNLAFMSPDKPFRTLLVTSGGPSEGKTTVACWLATAMAQAGQRVLLMDCDLRRPRIHRVFNLLNDQGVTSVLLDHSTLKDAIRATEVPGLSVIVAGPASPSPAENLGSKSFETLLAELTATYDRVILDSPPMGPVTDAVVLSTRVDATVLVVRALSSARDMVRHAARSINDVRGNLAGAVLNAADPDRNGYAYYRYYGKRGTESGANERD